MFSRPLVCASPLPSYKFGLCLSYLSVDQGSKESFQWSLQFHSDRLHDRRVKMSGTAVTYILICRSEAERKWESEEKKTKGRKGKREGKTLGMAWVFWNINSPQWHSPFNKNIPPSPSLKVPPTRDQVFTYEFTGDIFIQTTKSHSLAPISCGYILVQNAFSQTSKVPVVFLSQCCLRVQSSKSFLRLQISLYCNLL